MLKKGTTQKAEFAPVFSLDHALHATHKHTHTHTNAQSRAKDKTRTKKTDRKEKDVGTRIWGARHGLTYCLTDQMALRLPLKKMENKMPLRLLIRAHASHATYTHSHTHTHSMERRGTNARHIVEKHLKAGMA